MQRADKFGFNRARILIVVVLLLPACDVNHGLTPIRSSISGSVSFQGPPIGTNVAEIRVAATKVFPPLNLTTDIIYGEKIVIDPDSLADGVQEVPFEIKAPLGTYPAVGVLWRESGRSWEVTNILGLYTDPLSFAPKPVTLSDDTLDVTDVAIVANTSYTQRNAFIEGEITFEGEWPPDTEIMALAVFPIVPNPQNPFDFLTLQALDIAVPIFREGSYNYRTRVPGGTYPFVSVFWKGKAGGLLDIRAIGFHACPGDSLSPRTVIVPENSTATGVDIVVKLESLPGGVKYNLGASMCN